MSTASKAASATLALFGGGFGLALTILTLILPELLSYISALGEEKNAHEELIESLDEENAKENRNIIIKWEVLILLKNYQNNIKKWQRILKNDRRFSRANRSTKRLSNTYKAVKDIIEGLSDENNKYTVSTDENGKIIVKVNGNIVDSFNDLKSATTEFTKQKLEADVAQLESSKATTEAIIKILLKE